MTHPFDQLSPFCEKHQCQKIISKHQKGKQVSIAWVCPECAKEDLTPLLRNIENVFRSYFGGQAAFAIAFTLPPEYNYCHWITNVSRENGIELFEETVKKMKTQPR